jgi:hypothetical protein
MNTILERRSLIRFSLALAILLAACSSDSGSGSSGTNGPSGPSGPSGPGDSGTPGAASSPAPKGKLGDNCSSAADCSTDQCLTARGASVGFCTRQCTSNADCPESGYECNLSPYTACVPK